MGASYPRSAPKQTAAESTAGNAAAPDIASTRHRPRRWRQRPQRRAPTRKDQIACYDSPMILMTNVDDSQTDLPAPAIARHRPKSQPPPYGFPRPAAPRLCRAESAADQFRSQNKTLHGFAGPKRHKRISAPKKNKTPRGFAGRGLSDSLLDL